MKLITKENKIDLKSFIAKNFNISKSKAKNIIDGRQVFVNNKRAWIASYVLNKGDIVEIMDFNEKKEINEINIIYEDDYIVAVDKPSGIITDKSNNSFENLIRKKLKNENIRAIHRLDKDTSGVLLFAKNDVVFEKFKKLWQEKGVEKIYIAISLNEANFGKKEVKIPIEGKEAISYVEKIAINDGLTLFKIKTFTGRKHQIRIHLAKIGYPVLGDKVYGPNTIKDEKYKKIPRQLLHTFKIIYDCPFKNKKVVIQSGIPDDFYVFKGIKEIIKKL